LDRVIEVLHTCNWTSDSLDDNESLGSLQDAELDFELDAFRDEDAEDGGSEQDVEYMERMMTMLLHARGTKSTLNDVNPRNGGRDAAGRTQAMGATDDKHFS